MEDLNIIQTIVKTNSMTNNGKSPRLNKSLDERLRGNRRLGQLRRFIHQKDT